LVLVVSPTRLFTGWLAYWAVCYKLCSVPARDDYNGADASAVTATPNEDFVCSEGFCAVASILLPQNSFVEAPFAATKKSAGLSNR
jgi:hypothetical protein